MSPPGAFPHNPTPAAVDRRGWKAARRDVLVQCDNCGCLGTGRMNGRGRLVSVNLAAAWGRVIRHADCGGAFAAFDIEAR